MADHLSETQLPLDLLRQIDALCAQFETALRAGQRIDPAMLLEQVPNVARGALVHELLLVELEQHVPADFDAVVARWRQQFPEWLDAINAARAKAAMSSQWPRTRSVGMPGQIPPTCAYASTPGDTPGHSHTRSSAGASIGDGASCAVPGPRRIGRYEVERVLGEGGFGTVYLARDVELARSVAIKIPKRSRVGSQADLERYMAEARMVAGLDHPGIVPVYDVERTEDGLCYVVSKYIPGTTLSQRLQRGRLPLDQAVRIVRRVAEALDYAHRKGLIHRDVKPANLLLDPHGNVYVADFGLALPLDEAGTSEGLAGTPEYMSPEQAGGPSQIDARSDIFSLGVVFYELLTGQRPFHANSATKLFQQIQGFEPPPPRFVDPQVPNELSRICQKCLVKDPSARFATAQELVVALARWEKESGVEQAESEVLPAGFEPFGAEAAGLYLGLLPGASGDGALPKEVQFWLDRIDKAQAGGGFRVAVLAGAPGAGKSSLVKAGLLPSLAAHVQPVYVTADYLETEARIRAALSASFPDFRADVSLAEGFRLVRRLPPEGPAKQVLIVLDQFEAWLIANPAPGNTELAKALARCDGRRLQCLLVVRTEFRQQAQSLVASIATRSEAGGAVLTLEPFKEDHARRVLLRLGQAYRRLPEREADLTEEQNRFINLAAARLCQNGRVHPLRLAQFVRWRRNAAWRPALLSRLTGVPDLIRACIEERFGDPKTGAGSPLGSVAAILSALLPPEGGRIQEHTRSYSQLQHAFDGADDGADLAELLSVLDGGLRVVTAIGPEVVSADSQPIARDFRGCIYRLTDELAARGVREWLGNDPEMPRAKPIGWAGAVGAVALTVFGVVLLAIASAGGLLDQPGKKSTEWGLVYCGFVLIVSGIGLGLAMTLRSRVRQVGTLGSVALTVFGVTLLIINSAGGLHFYQPGPKSTEWWLTYCAIALIVSGIGLGVAVTPRSLRSRLWRVRKDLDTELVDTKPPAVRLAPTSVTRLCPSCQRPIPGDALWCAFCEKVLTSPDPPTSRRFRLIFGWRRRPKAWQVVFPMLGLFGFWLYIAYLGPLPKIPTPPTGPGALQSGHINEKDASRSSEVPDAREQSPAKRAHQRISQLIAGLKSSKPGERLKAARALRELGLAAKDAVPMLTEVLSDDEFFVREGAAEALGSMGLWARTSVPALLATLRGPELTLRDRALDALASIDQKALVTDGVPLLIAEMHDGTPAGRIQAIRAVGLIGPEAKAAVPALAEALKDPSAKVSECAREALTKIDPTALATVPPRQFP
jgi:Protein kinase domain/HEAT repeats